MRTNSVVEKIHADFDRVCQIATGDKNIPMPRKIRLFCFAYGFQVIMAHRMYCGFKHALRNPVLFIPGIICLPLCRILLFILSRMYDIHIATDADIGKGLYIGHFGGVRIGNCSIGENCNVNHQVKIGFDGARKDRQNHVTIMNNVWIGAHSHLNGSITIGHGATIAAGAIISKDVADCQLVGGSSGRVINNNYNNAALLGIHA